MAPPTRTRTRTRLARPERRDQIVDAAAEVFRVRDPSLVTFEEIADAAGVSRALLYNYFGDRQGLLEAVEQRQLDDLAQRVASSVAGAVTQREALAACVRAHLDAAGGDPAGYRMLAGRATSRVGASAVEQTLGPALADQPLLVRAGAFAAVHAMVLGAHEQHLADDPDTVEAITDFLAGALTGDLADPQPLLSA